MNSRYDYLQDPQSRSRLALFRSSVAVGIVIGVLAIGTLAAKGADPGAAVGTEFSDAATSMYATGLAPEPAPVESPGATDLLVDPARASAAAIEFSGALGRFSDEPAEQPPTF